MKSILLFDTSVASFNIGDEIINDSIRRNWPELYKDNYIFRMATHTPSFSLWQHYKVKDSISKFDYKFLCGTNILYTNMVRPLPGWNVYPWNTAIQHGSICIGAGIGVNSKSVNYYTKAIYDKLLSRDYVHSVRDEKAKVLLEYLGFKAVNTGCPTLWGLGPEVCKDIPKSKSDRVIFTLTNYQADRENDQLMVDIIKSNYKEVYFWPQSVEDYDYMKSLNNTDGIIVVAPNLYAYDRILNEDIDYVGNRLHGGIYALQHKCRSILIGIDYRLEEMRKNFSLPGIERNSISEKLDSLINSNWSTSISGMDFNVIDDWKKQFVL